MDEDIIEKMVDTLFAKKWRKRAKYDFTSGNGERQRFFDIIAESI